MQTLSAAAASLPEKLSFSFDEACHELGCSRTKLHGLVGDGKIAARKLGARTIFLRADLVAFLSALPLARAA